MKCVGIDIGGHTISAGLIDISLSGSCIELRCHADTPNDRALDSLLDCVAELVSCLASNSEIACVGLGVPAFLDVKRRRIERLTNFGGIGDIDFPSMLESKLAKAGLHVPVFMENDANCAALGEGICGKAKGMKDYAVITLGTGIGSGIVSGGRLITGAHGMGGELGHVAVTDSAAVCGCGGISHLEQSASADWIEKKAKALGLPADFEALWNMRNTKGALDLTQMLDALARGIASLMVITDPEAIILSGGMSRALGLTGELAPRVLDYLPTPFRPHLNLLVSELGSDAALFGAAGLYLLNQDALR